MINKILNVYLIGIMILCMLCLTLGPFVLGIVLSIVFNDCFYLLLNLMYIILFPVIIIAWRFIFEMIVSGNLI